jgi:hypothetical protein
MLSIIKNSKTKKKIRKQKNIQRGGSGRTSRSNHPSQQENIMPSAFRKMQNEVAHMKLLEQFPDAPKFIPKFRITVSIKDLEELQKIFGASPILDRLLDSYKIMHLRFQDLEPRNIKKDLLDANKILERMIELLKKQYINNTKEKNNIENAIKADKWCDYIKKLIEFNKKNIIEIDEFLAI